MLSNRFKKLKKVWQWLSDFFEGLSTVNLVNSRDLKDSWNFIYRGIQTWNSMKFHLKTRNNHEKRLISWILTCFDDFHSILQFRNLSFQPPRGFQTSEYHQTFSPHIESGQNLFLYFIEICHLKKLISLDIPRFNQFL